MRAHSQNLTTYPSAACSRSKTPKSSHNTVLSEATGKLYASNLATTRQRDNNQVPQTTKKALSLKQARELISEIVSSKRKYDE